MRIDGVFFDIGETLISEERIYASWADWLDVPRHSFLSKLGALLATGGTVRDLFEYFRPGFDLAKEERLRQEAGVPNGFGPPDLYPDARDCLRLLRSQGLYVGVAGNQPARAQQQFEALGLEYDLLGISEVWGISKPSPEFFARCAALSGLPPSRILYVGDRIDNDVRPGLEFGVQMGFLRRGPWGHIMTDPQALARCTFVLDDLASLPALVRAHNA
jgi:HAD superfamily hydrolase (TIGR01549 family)